MYISNAMMTAMNEVYEEGLREKRDWNRFQRVECRAQKRGRVRAPIVKERGEMDTEVAATVDAPLTVAPSGMVTAPTSLPMRSDGESVARGESSKAFSPSKLTIFSSAE